MASRNHFSRGVKDQLLALAQVASAPVMKSSADSKVDGTGNNVGDVWSVMHFSPNRSMPGFGLNPVSPNQLTIFYKESACVYHGIPAEKVREIMLIAAAAAKSTEMKIGIQSPFTSHIPTNPSSLQGTTNNLASSQALCFPAEKSSICRLQEFPIARRQSLQRFLEKRRVRLGSKAPYSTTKVADNIENNFFVEEGFVSSIVAS